MCLVSVIMPVYNAEKYLAAAIESILKQSYSKLELIIINDCSQDNSALIITSYAQTDSRIIVLDNQRNSKQAYSRNRGLAVATGCYLAFLDADDIAHPERIKRQVEFLATNSSYSGCGSFAEYIGPDGKRSGKLIAFSGDCGQLKAAAFFGINPFVQSAMLIRKDIVNRYSLKYSEQLGGISEDYQFWLTFLRYNLELANLTEVLVYYRFGDPAQATIANAKKFLEVNQRLIRQNIDLICSRSGSLISRLYVKCLNRNSFWKRFIGIWGYPLLAWLIFRKNRSSRVLDQQALKGILNVQAPTINLLQFFLK